jgi:G3E family GTPase
VATAVHAHGIRAVVMVLRRPMSRLDFSLALGRLAREHGEDLLRVKGIVAFADRDAGPAAVHAVQHTLYPPRWFDSWPDSDRRSRLVFIVHDIDSEILLERFAAGDPVLAEK